MTFPKKDVFLKTTCSPVLVTWFKVRMGLTSSTRITTIYRKVKEIILKTNKEDRHTHTHKHPPHNCYKGKLYCLQLLLWRSNILWVIKEIALQKVRITVPVYRNVLPSYFVQRGPMIAFFIPSWELQAKCHAKIITGWFQNIEKQLESEKQLPQNEEMAAFSYNCSPRWFRGAINLVSASLFL